MAVFFKHQLLLDAIRTGIDAASAVISEDRCASSDVDVIVNKLAQAKQHFLKRSRCGDGTTLYQFAKRLEIIKYF